mgnify:CR=1 FL=1
MSEKKIVICDIDGTTANNDHRQHFLEGKKDWDGFFSSLWVIFDLVPLAGYFISVRASASFEFKYLSLKSSDGFIVK